MRLHHIGIAVKSVQKAAREYRVLLGAEVTAPVIYDPVQDAILCMMKTEDGMRLELVEGKPVEQYLLKKIRMYHICCVTRDLEAEIARMRHSGGVLVSEPKPAVLFGGRRVAFLYTRIGLIELLEENDGEESG